MSRATSGAIMKRRDAFRWAAGASLAGMAGLGLPASQAAEVMGQKEFLFWLDDRDRSAVRTAAEQILKEIDVGVRDARYLQGLYQRAGSVTHARYPTGVAFSDRVASNRGSLGALKARSVQGVEGGFRMLPNLPGGEYVIAIYDSIFAGAPDILYTEQVTLSREPGVASSPWTFVEYYVNAKPFYKY
ncbi:DUF4019 domain-containing protein [Ralstonia solanacearum]|uniref:DUF4019 domain-containing protein n=1 Tax=Ralstonia solanacearum TaxID=305 RepID=UPI0004BCAE0E|nr:DUF4019 domain-containing protein [Ralstonia solanacearum]AMP69818.1 hypothetical protein UW163_10195 [Ralstonia solanacearum]AMP73271.1 hypothetical protein RALBFv3_03465 [Ralstonia solanacearum]AYB60204.1 DUF4019 domain-containing protein [Ralstonia solanacearum]MBB6587014.1 DUF4019 domain-containing protein [Ralstonia solanacearum]OAI73646.1 hypothetical protein RSP797_05715 [Ralstonia solanacearum]